MENEVSHTGNCEFEAMMAESNVVDPFQEENNFSEGIPAQEVTEGDRQLVQVGDASANTPPMDAMNSDRGEREPCNAINIVELDVAHVGIHDDENKSIPLDCKKTKLSPIHMPGDRKTDPCISPENGGKRKRVQHDYRRLSSSGYVDDYIGRERFSGTSESDLSLSPTPPKTKPPRAVQANAVETPKTSIYPGLYIHDILEYSFSCSPC